MLVEPALGRTTSGATFGTSTVVLLPRAAGPSSTPSLVGKTARRVRLHRSFLGFTLLTALPVGSVLAYVFYWLAVIVVLVYYKFREVK